jgi:hypothetical protein
VPFDALSKESIIAGVHMANMRSDCGPHSVAFECLGGRRTPNAPTVLEACVLGDKALGSRRAARENLANASGELLEVGAVSFGSPLCRAETGPFPSFVVGQAFLFGQSQASLIDKETLPLVALPRPAPLQDDGRQDCVLPSPPGERLIAGG